MGKNNKKRPPTKPASISTQPPPSVAPVPRQAPPPPPPHAPIDPPSRFLCSDVLGLDALFSLTVDGRILLACRGLRMFSYGLLAVFLVLYLKSMGFAEAQVGLLFTLTLLGDAGVSLFMTSRADVVGRRFILKASALLKLTTGLIFCLTTRFWLLTIAAVFGVISPSGKEIGPFLPVEHAGLSQVIPGSNRTRIFAWHNLVGNVCSAIGALICGELIMLLVDHAKWSEYDAYRCVMAIYAVCGLLLFFLFSFLSPAVEAPVGVIKALPLGQFLGLHESKWLVLRLSLLFMIDAFAGSFILQSLLTNWFALKYHSPPATLGSIVFFSNLIAGVSALFAAHLASLIGLVLTMVVTHLPSNIMLVLVPLMPNEFSSIVMLCSRYTISQMDVPTRNAYVMGVVHETERSAASGVTNIVRSVGASLGPYFAGLLYEKPATRDFPFYIAGGLKIIYDLLLLVAFSAIKPTEERHQSLEETTPLRGVTVKI